MVRKTTVLKSVLPVLAVILGIALMKLLAAQRQPPHQQVRETRGVLVETRPVERAPFPVRVQVSGTVQPRLRSVLAPQIAGRVVAVSPKLVEGGFFQQGEELFRLEPRDFELAVQQAEARLAEAKRNLLTVESRARVARQEWATLNGDTASEPNPLVLFKPQLAEAKAQLASARAGLEQARLSLARTRVYAPFNGRVVQENLDVGQYLRAGDGVVTLVGTDEAEILVPVPLAELKWLQVPGIEKTESGSPAEIRLPGTDFRWTGRIGRSLAEVDARGRMPRLAVTVADPFNLSRSGNRPDLTLGLFVEVTLLGPTLDQAISIPRAALREKNSVWLMGSDGTLHIQAVEVRRIQEDQVVLSGGLTGGERLVMTPLAGAAEGMKLRTQAEERS